MYVVKNFKFDHLGTSSSQKNLIMKLKLIETGILVGLNFIFIKKIIVICLR